MNIQDIIRTNNQNFSRKAKAKLWEGKHETRVYIDDYNGSRGRPWIQKGYIRITVDGTAADFRAERTLDWRSEAVAALADALSTELTPSLTPSTKPTTRKEIMARAWAIARAAAKQFGGNSRAYYAASLKQAWAESR